MRMKVRSVNEGGTCIVATRRAVLRCKIFFWVNHHENLAIYTRERQGRSALSSMR